MKGWSLKDIKRTDLAYKSTLVGKSVLPKQMPIGLAFIIAYLSRVGIEFQVEYKFLKDRKFRFDVYFETNGKRVGIEYDGLNSDKSRHTTLVGFSKDREKINLAQINGFIVLGYTALNYKDFINHFEQLK